MKYTFYKVIHQFLTFFEPERTTQKLKCWFIKFAFCWFMLYNVYLYFLIMIKGLKMITVDQNMLLTNVNKCRTSLISWVHSIKFVYFLICSKWRKCCWYIVGGRKKLKKTATYQEASCSTFMFLILNLQMYHVRLKHVTADGEAECLFQKDKMAAFMIWTYCSYLHVMLFITN